MVQEGNRQVNRRAWRRAASGFSLGEYHTALVGNFDQLHRLRGLHRHCDVQRVSRRDENRSSIAFFARFIAGDWEQRVWAPSRRPQMMAPSPLWEANRPWDAATWRPDRRRNRYGAVSSSRKSARSAWYLAAARSASEPCMMAIPWVVPTHHVHFRPRFFKTISKVGYRSVMASGSRGIILHNKAHNG
jgi:hypothetical protein